MILTLLMALAGAVQSGSYGTYIERFEGFTLRADISAGAFSGPDAGRQEQELMDHRRRMAKKRFVRLRPVVERAIAHYRKGGGLARLLAKGAALEASPGHEVVARVPLLGAGIPEARDDHVDLHLRRPVAPAVARRIAADFLLAQHRAGGVARAGEPWNRKVTVVFLAGLDGCRRLSGSSLRFVRAHRALLAGLDLRGLTVERRTIAALWLVWLKGKSPGAGAVVRLARDERTRSLLLLALALTPTRQLPDRLRRLRKVVPAEDLRDLEAIVAALR